MGSLMDLSKQSKYSAEEIKIKVAEVFTLYVNEIMDDLNSLFCNVSFSKEKLELRFNEQQRKDKFYSVYFSIYRHRIYVQYPYEGIGTQHWYDLGIYNNDKYSDNIDYDRVKSVMERAFKELVIYVSQKP